MRVGKTINQLIYQLGYLRELLQKLNCYRWKRSWALAFSMRIDELPF